MAESSAVTRLVLMRRFRFTLAEIDAMDAASMAALLAFVPADETVTVRHRERSVILTAPFQSLGILCGVAFAAFIVCRFPRGWSSFAEVYALCVSLGAAGGAIGYLVRRWLGRRVT